jgi:hypothetical protein
MRHWQFLCSRDDCGHDGDRHLRDRPPPPPPPPGPTARRALLDFVGDGRADAGVYRSSTGDWLIRRSSDGAMLQRAWGAPMLGDVPVPADYDGDGKTDIAGARRGSGSSSARRTAP